MKKILLMLLIITSVFAFPAKVKKIVDGDTITVITEDGNVTKIRFADIDSPEKYLISKKAKYDIIKCGRTTFEMGKLASKHLTTLVKIGDNVDVNLTGNTSYNRDVGIISTNGTNLNNQMVIDGYAIVWHTGRDIINQTYKEELLNHQADAISRSNGFWKIYPQEMECLKNYHK